ncbi:MAG TPA: hypothetical protein VFX30_04770 [bacterium]|nr:hypothetical protein [bacterium]
MNADLLFRDSLKLSGDPRLAETQWEGLRPFLSDAAKKTDGLRFLFALLGNSRFLVERLIRFPDPATAVDALVSSRHLLKPKTDREMSEEFSSAYARRVPRDLASGQKLLRVFKYGEMTRIAARDLSGLAPHEEIGRELAALAAVATEGALKIAEDLVHDRDPAPFTVFALGKFGGEDLNFSSDIDILYVHGRPRSESGGRVVLEHYCRVSETVTRLLHDRTEDGFVFRVDLDLRPEGKSGVIVNSVDALASYYETSGAVWERAVLTKARPVAGDAELGRETLALLAPFVYPRHLDSSSIDGLKSMKSRINAEMNKTKGGGYHVKLGAGGIREIEFFVTAFQLIYGGKDPTLRERHTLTALSALRDRGLVPAEDAARLADAYVFLRRIENRLQMEDERQTHRLPTATEEKTALARRMGFADTAAFEEALTEKTGFVYSCFERLAS